MATADNLQAAFAGESQANRKYLAFAQKAEAEGYPQIAKLFRAAAAAETASVTTTSMKLFRGTIYENFTGRKISGHRKNAAARRPWTIDRGPSSAVHRPSSVSTDPGLHT